MYGETIINLPNAYLPAHNTVKKLAVLCFFVAYFTDLQAQTVSPSLSNETTKVNANVNSKVNKKAQHNGAYSKLPRIETKVCTFFEKYNKYQAECGTLYVQENPETANTAEAPARVTSIPIMIFQPQGEITDAPLLVTGGGGPGGAVYIMDGFDGDPDLFYKGLESSTLQAGRQLIVMEMRGSGESVANLDCPQITDLEINFLTTYPYKLKPQKLLQTLTECAKNKAAMGIDANFYNIDYAIEDIETLRTLLGIKHWHLLGISHGTRISLQYAKKYPEHTASLVLDSIYPFEADSYVDMPYYSEQIFTQAFRLCDANPDCRLSNGNASISLFDTFMRNLKAQAIELELEYFDEIWGSGSKNLKISPELIAYALYSNSYNTEAIFAFPAIIKDAVNKDYKKLVKLISETIDLQNYTWFSEGAYASYACYEEIPFTDFSLAFANAEKYSTPYWNAADLINLEQQICKIWNIKAATYPIKDFDHSQLTMPILILAGGLDAYTPVKWAIDFQQKLPLKDKTQHLRIWPLKSHNVVYDDECVESVLTSFLNEPQNTIHNDCALQDAEAAFKKAEAKLKETEAKLKEIEATMKDAEAAFKAAKDEVKALSSLNSPHFTFIL